MRRLTPPQLVIISFLCAILLGTIVLALPQATHGPERLSITDSLFTATSAVCVTGLVVKDTGSRFTGFGKGVIFTLFQIGGLGIMTFSTLFAVMLGRKIGFTETDVIRSTLDQHSIVGLKRLVLYILAITIGTEAIGASVLFFRWKAITDWTVLETLKNAVFHSVSGFCNAGFSLFRNNLENFQHDPYINMTMMLLIFLGGIGFIVIMDLARIFRVKGPERRLSLQSKVVLITSGVLIVAGAAILILFENNGVMKGLSWPDRIMGGLFQSVTARTAGFNTLQIGKMTIPSLMGLVLLMFIGASPGSTGGGIKTCTFAVLGATFAAMFTAKRRVMIAGRSIPRQVMREALVIFFMAAGWIFLVTMLLAFFEGGNLGQRPFMNALFEVTSAFGTVGLSTGITPALSDISKTLISLTMLAGRVGPLTLALAVAFRKRKDNYLYPEENIMVG